MSSTAPAAGSAADGHSPADQPLRAAHAPTDSASCCPGERTARTGAGPSADVGTGTGRHAHPASSTVPASKTPTPAATATATFDPSAAHSGSQTAPTLTELLDFTRRTAADHELIGSLPLDSENRTWLRLDGPGGSEAWVIGWPPGTGTAWHDHGGSHGALATAAGTLMEHSLAIQLPTEGWRTLELADGVDRERQLALGQGRAFGPHHVHQVLNLSTERHAVSVHAYHPPLPLMRHYSRSGPLLRFEGIERPEEWQ